MDVKFLNRLPNRVEIIENSLKELRKDFQLNIKDGLFKEGFGRTFSFEEFLVMMVVEKDIQLRVFKESVSSKGTRLV